MKMVLQLFALSLGLTVNSIAQLIVDQVPPSLLTGPGKTNTISAVPATQATATRHQPKSTSARWEKFEAEFGITEKDPALVKGSLQSAKYQLDQTTFALQELVNNVEDRLRFDYGVRDLTSTPSPTKTRLTNTGNPLLDTLYATRLQSDISLRPSGRQFVGVKLVLPLGN